MDWGDEAELRELSQAPCMGPHGGRTSLERRRWPRLSAERDGGAGGGLLSCGCRVGISLTWGSAGSKP